MQVPADIIVVIDSFVAPTSLVAKIMTITEALVSGSNANGPVSGAAGDTPVHPATIIIIISARGERDGGEVGSER